MNLNTNNIPRRRPLELDQVVVGAVSGEEGAAACSKYLRFASPSNASGVDCEAEG